MKKGAVLTLLLAAAVAGCAPSTITEPGGPYTPGCGPICHAHLDAAKAAAPPNEQAIEACKTAYRDSPPQDPAERWRPRPRPAACAGLTSAEHAAAFDRFAKEQMKQVLEHAEQSAKIRSAQDKIAEAQWARRRQAAAPIEDKAVKAWGECLRAAARAMALASSEPASVVVEAAFGGCFSAEREYIVQFDEAHIGLLRGPGSEIAALIKEKFVPTLLAEAIAARALRAAAKPTESTQPLLKLPQSNDI